MDKNMLSSAPSGHLGAKLGRSMAPHGLRETQKNVIKSFLEFGNEIWFFLGILGAIKMLSWALRKTYSGHLGAELGRSMAPNGLQETRKRVIKLLPEFGSENWAILGIL